MGLETTDPSLPRGLTKHRSKRRSYRIREIVLGDLNNGFLEALSNLSHLRGLRPEDAKSLLLKIKLNPFHKIFVALNESGKVVGTTTLIIEQKFIHDGGLVGHIEDVSVRKGNEGGGVGSALINKALETAQEFGCYKVILDCSKDLTKFYERLGFRKHEVAMRKDLP
ncbi:MAG: GNAT family N-acetyltransferase [Thaumarchaeota archaeon]|nr:GNAT family N-acetyltransferase [Nitrososphaerota archaeon]